MHALMESTPVEYIDVTEVMRRYGLSRSGVIAAIHRDDLPARRYGKTWAVDPRHAAILWEKRLLRRRPNRTSN